MFSPYRIVHFFILTVLCYFYRRVISDSILHLHLCSQEEITVRQISDISAGWIEMNRVIDFDKIVVMGKR